MDKKKSSLETSWDQLLSRDPKLILRTYQSLNLESQKVVTDHLLKMVSETGWHPEQAKSARSAIEALEEAGLIK